MKKIYLGIILNIIWFTSFAQAPFTASNCFQLNDSSKLGFALVMQSFDNYVSQTGNNYVWDFTNAGFPGPWGTWTSPTTPYKFQPSSQSTHVVFQSTQINEYANVAFARDHFYSYAPSNDTLYCYGYNAGSDNQYYNRIPYLTFPLNFQDSIYTYTPQTVGTTSVGSISRYWIYDGFGSVNFAYGSANNVYRIRTKQIDSSYINGTFISAIIKEEMIWFRQSDGIPVLRFEKQGASNINAYYASASGSATTAIGENTESEPLQVYPNPAHKSISIKSTESLVGSNYRINDITGKQIGMGRIKAENTSIDISALKPGLYFIRMDSDCKKAFKFVKE